MRKLRFLILFLAIALVVQTASVAYANTVLPSSSYYEGTTYYNNTGGYIDFAVYDTQSTDGQEFESRFGTAPGAGKYIYAYQIFADENSELINYFAIIGINESTFAKPINDNIGSLDDLTGDGITPDNAFITATLDYENYGLEYGGIGAWVFDSNPLDEDGGQHSVILVLRSDYEWIAGNYTFDRQIANSVPIVTPEPGTLALLGFGSAMLLRRRRKSIR
ncbi:MAG: PEP-CTERM sorting domain-containing protein [Planctomycetes bacterium]|nr:PEP-CTERM sorting domain-containing protein [Planctomycetota bacterium]